MTAQEDKLQILHAWFSYAALKFGWEDKKSSVVHIHVIQKRLKGHIWTLIPTQNSARIKDRQLYDKQDTNNKILNILLCW